LIFTIKQFYEQQNFITIDYVAKGSSL
jgi:hypothetical protein